MRESVLSKIMKCPICKTAYMPENGEICKCDRPDPIEEPRVRDWEDQQFMKALGYVNQAES